MNTPNTGIPLVPEGTLDPAAGLNEALDVVDALLQTAVISLALTAPPGTSQDGDLYIVAGEGGTATGDWAGHENDLARKVSEGDFWQFFTAGVQVHLVVNQDDLGLYRFDTGSPGGWSLAAGLGDAPTDGALYARRDATWEAIPGGLTVQDEQSPPTLETDVVELGVAGFVDLSVLSAGRVRLNFPGGLTVRNEDSPPTEVAASVLVIGDNLELTEPSPGVARIEGENGGGGGTGGGNLTPDTHPESADDLDDEFEETGVLDPKWVWFNQGTANETIAQGAAQLVSTTGADNLNLLAQTAPATPWRVRAKVFAFMQSNFAHGGLTVYNSGNSRAITFDVQWNSSNTLGVFRYTNLATFATSVVSAIPMPGAGGVPIYLEIENNGTNLLFRYSLTGYDGQFVLFATEPLATHIVAVTDVGMSVNPGASAELGRIFVDWFRRFA